MKKKWEQLPDKTKNVIRIVAFAVAFIVAITAITNGVLQIGRKKTGFTEVTEAASEEAVRYGSDYKLMYYMTGSQSEIKEFTNKISADYSRILLELWKLTDPETEYEEMTNLATLNLNPGNAYVLPGPLFEMLSDALEKTEEGLGYSVFAGTFYDEWDTIRSLFDPLEYEPELNPEQKARFERLSALGTEEGTFTLELDASSETAVFSYSEAYGEALSGMESEAPVLDFNLLREAYVAEAVIRELEKLGYTEGYLETAGGLIVSLSGNSRGYASFYGQTDGKTSLCAMYPAKENRAASYSRLFALEEGEFGYYTVPDAEGNSLRGPFIAAFQEPSSVLASSMTVTEDGKAVLAVYDNLKLYAFNAEDSLRAAAEASDTPVIYTLYGSEKVICRNKAAEALALSKGSGWTVKTLE